MMQFLSLKSFAEALRGAKPRFAPRADGGKDYLLKLALADKLALTVTAQIGAVPVQAPDHEPNVLPAGGVAVSVTAVPGATVAEQAVPQLIPPTSLVTTPGLLVLTLSWKLAVVVPPPPPPPPPPAATVLKVAMASLMPLMVATQLPVPVQAPLQPAKLLPLLALAFSVTTAPAV